MSKKTKTKKTKTMPTMPDFMSAVRLLKPLVRTVDYRAPKARTAWVRFGLSGVDLSGFTDSVSYDVRSTLRLSAEVDHDGVETTLRVDLNDVVATKLKKVSKVGVRRNDAGGCTLELHSGYTVVQVPAVEDLGPESAPARFSDEAYRDLPEVAVLTGLGDAIRCVNYARSKHESRPSMWGVRVDAEDLERTVVVATDGHRMAIAETGRSPISFGLSEAIATFVAKVSGEASVTLYAHTDKQRPQPWDGKLAPLCFRHKEPRVRLAGPGWTVLMEEQDAFPLWRQVLPSVEWTTTATVRAEALRGVLASVPAGHLQGVTLLLEEGCPELQMSWVAEDLEGSAEVHCLTKVVAPDKKGVPRLKLAVCAKYLAQALRPKEGWVTLDFIDDLMPIRVSYDDGTRDYALVMPMRL